jgi:hypothetical protein
VPRPVPARAAASFIDLTDLLIIHAQLQQSLDRDAASNARTLERSTMMAVLT